MDYSGSAGEQPTRRKLLATGAVISTGMMVAGPVFGNGDSSSEIEAWQKLQGAVFVAIGPSTSRRGRRNRLKLAGVEFPEARDPQLPAGFRDPFLLIFCPDQAGVMEQGIYEFVSPEGDKLSMFINETLATGYSKMPVMQAAFC